MPGSNYGYDVMVAVGIMRFLESRQREQIRTALDERYGIAISTGQVSALVHRFAEYLERLHHSKAGALAAALAEDGGWPLHVDATGEAGRGTVLVVLAGWRQWVLGAWKISTEREELILACLRDVVRRFGTPCAAMRDMGRAMIPALNTLANELDLAIPILTCHQHFVADVGRDLLNTGHKELCALLRKSKVRPMLRMLVRALGRDIGRDMDAARQGVLNWQAWEQAGNTVPCGRDGLAVVRSLAQWVLDFKERASGMNFPFDRPYLDLYERCRQGLQATEGFLKQPPKDRKVVRLLRRLRRILGRVQGDVPFKQVARNLRQHTALVDEMRTVLQLTSEEPDTSGAEDVAHMRVMFEEWLASLAARRPARGPGQNLRQAIDLIVTHVRVHGENLWGHAMVVQCQGTSAVRMVARTNALCENFFKDLKHKERRRSGRKNLGQELEHFPAGAALAANLKKNDYVQIVCGSMDRLPRAFAELDEQVRNNRRNGVVDDDSRDDLRNVLQLQSAALSSQDRRIVRNKQMERRILAASGKRRIRA